MEKTENEVAAALIRLKKLLRVKNSPRPPLLRLPTEIILHILSYLTEYMQHSFVWHPVLGTLQYWHHHAARIDKKIQHSGRMSHRLIRILNGRHRTRNSLSQGGGRFGVWLQATYEEFWPHPDSDGAISDPSSTLCLALCLLLFRGAVCMSSMCASPTSKTPVAVRGRETNSRLVYLQLLYLKAAQFGPRGQI